MAPKAVVSPPSWCGSNWCQRKVGSCNARPGARRSWLWFSPLSPSTTPKELCRTTFLNVGYLNICKNYICWRTECHRYEKLTQESNTEGAHPSDVPPFEQLRGKLIAEQCLAKSLKFSENCSSSFLKENLWYRGQATCFSIILARDG